MNTCFTATARDSTIKSGHVFDTVRVGRAADTIATPGGTTRYSYVRWKRPSRHVTLMATCVIPKGQAARTAVEARFRAEARRNEGGAGSAVAEEDQLEEHIAEEVESRAPESAEPAADFGSGHAGPAHHAVAAAPLARGLLYNECDFGEGWLSCNDFACDYDWAFERWECEDDCLGYWGFDLGDFEFYFWLECDEEVEWAGGGGPGNPPASDFVLECNGSVGPITVERAQNVTCEATTTPNGTISSLEWYFDGNRFEVTGDSIGTENPLSGPMLDSGTLTISGEINYITAGSAAVQIRVTPRTWTWAGRATYDSTRAAPDCFTAHWHASATWGWAIGMDTLGNGPGCGASNRLFTPNHSATTGDRGFTITRVTSGPNTGLWRVGEFTTGLRMRSAILRSFRADGEGYPVTLSDTLPIRSGCTGFGLPDTLTLATVNISCMNFTGLHQFGGMIDSLRRHERCHARVAIDTFNVMPNVAAQVEGVVGADSGAAFDLALQRISDAHTRIWNATASLDPPITGAFNFWARHPTLGKWVVMDIAQSNWSVRAGC